MAQTALNMKTRSAQRRKTRIAATISYYSQSTKARVVDLSTAGLALDLGGSLPAALGSPVIIESEELGILEGTVKWSHNGRLGIQFRPNSNASAKVTSYFRFFHRDIKPVLTR
jgi:hypothetical protein